MVNHDFNRRAQAKPMGKGFVYLILAMAVANALLVMPAFYILN